MSSVSSAKAVISAGQAKIVAILAAVSGTGCTGAVANLAFLLAHAGRRVLVIDWGPDAPHVQEYLEPFLLGSESLPDDLARSLLTVRGAVPVRDGDQPLTAVRFALPEADGLIDVVVPVGEHGRSGEHPGLPPGDPGAVATLGKELRRAGYDDVLIDAPTDSAEMSPRLIAMLCDLAVVCFRQRPQAIQDAAELAGRLRRDAPTGIGLVPMVTAFDHGFQPGRIREVIQRAFADVLADQRPKLFDGGAVEIPYRSYDSFDPLLTVLVEEPSPGNSLYAGYGRLAAAATDDVITAPTAMSPTVRASYRYAFGLDSLIEPGRVLVAYAAPDRPWADWVRSRLERGGAQTRSLRQGRAWLDAPRPPGLVVVASERLDESAALAEVTEALARAEAGGTPLNVLQVQVGGPTTPMVREASAAVPADSEQLIVRLLSQFGLIERPRTEPADSLRAPGEKPDVFGAPPRNPRFVGRDEDIEALRDQLTGSARSPAVVTLSGASGVGKSELALEYAHRFASDYDLVWWVPAGSEYSVMTSLAGLAARLDTPGSHEFGTTAALDRLSNDPAYLRFLLVYDNVTDRAGLDELLPSEHQGHIIITSGEAVADEIELAAMTPGDSSLLLTSRVHGLSRHGAAQAAEAVRHLPLALELTATWLTETAAGVRRTGCTVAESATRALTEFLASLAGKSSDVASPLPQDVVSRVVAVVVDSLLGTPVGRIAVLLAQLCSFLSHDGIGLQLVRSRAMLDRLVAEGGGDAEPLRLDAGEIDRVLRTGVRYGLFHVAWGKESSLRLHRVLQASLRGAMTPGERTDRRNSVLASLAGFAPTEVEALVPHNVARFVELQRHVLPSGATESADDEVRRWLVNQLYFLYREGGQGVHRAALGPTQMVLDGWISRHGPTDPLCLRLASQLANLYRGVGDHSRALPLDDTALVGQRRSLARNHPQTLLSALGRGGDLRGLGLFAEALLEDQATWEGLREAFGEDHPQAHMAAHNLASAMFLSGDVAGALRLAEHNYHQRLRLLGENDVSTWSPLIQMGVYRRELGDYQAASRALRTAAQRLSALRRELNTVGASVQWHQAIVLRCEGSAAAAKGRNGEALRAFRELLGPDHPNTLACRLSYAAAARAVGGEQVAGVELVKTVLHDYLSTVGLVADHPFVALSRLSLGLAQCAAGLDGLQETHQGSTLLRGKLGAVHPWTLAAAVDHARVVAASGQSAERATGLAIKAHETCAEFLGAGHPYTIVAAHNHRLAVGHGGSDNEAWKEIDVDVPES